MKTVKNQKEATEHFESSVDVVICDDGKQHPLEVSSLQQAREYFGEEVSGDSNQGGSDDQNAGAGSNGSENKESGNADNEGYPGADSSSNPPTTHATEQSADQGATQNANGESNSNEGTSQQAGESIPASGESIAPTQN